MKKSLLVILTILAVLFCAAACKKEESSAPEGLQEVMISETEGFVFYGPLDWSVANDGKVAATYVSIAGEVRASVTLARAEGVDGTLKEYFDNQKSSFAYDISVKEEPAIALGNANGECYSVVYTFNYGADAKLYSCWQILAENGSDLYIFTYTAMGDYTNEESDYQKYVSEVRKAIDAVQFTQCVSGSSDGYEHGADGYKLVSDKKISGFELYLPNSAEVVSDGGFISAKLTDKANITVSRANDTGVGVLEYVKSRKTDLSKLVDNVTDIAVTLKNQPDTESAAFEGWGEVMTVTPTADETITFGDIDKNMIIAYEYTYEINGTKYHVYQILGVVEGILGTSINAAGYVFTYTATEDEYATHIDEIKTILQRMKF